MVIPTFDQLLHPTLDALHAQGGTAAISSITDHVLNALQLPPEETAEREQRSVAWVTVSLTETRKLTWPAEQEAPNWKITRCQH